MDDNENKFNFDEVAAFICRGLRHGENVTVVAATKQLADMVQWLVEKRMELHQFDIVRARPGLLEVTEKIPAKVLHLKPRQATCLFMSFFSHAAVEHTRLLALLGTDSVDSKRVQEARMIASANKYGRPVILEAC